MSEQQGKPNSVGIFITLSDGVVSIEVATPTVENGILSQNFTTLTVNNGELSQHPGTAVNVGASTKHGPFVHNVLHVSDVGLQVGQTGIQVDNVGIQVNEAEIAENELKNPESGERGTPAGADSAGIGEVLIAQCPPVDMATEEPVASNGAYNAITTAAVEMMIPEETRPLIDFGDASAVLKSFGDVPPSMVKPKAVHVQKPAVLKSFGDVPPSMVKPKAVHVQKPAAPKKIFVPFSSSAKGVTTRSKASASFIPKTSAAAKGMQKPSSSKTKAMKQTPAKKRPADPPGKAFEEHLKARTAMLHALMFNDDEESPSTSSKTGSSMKKPLIVKVKIPGTSTGQSKISVPNFWNPEAAFAANVMKSYQQTGTAMVKSLIEKQKEKYASAAAGISTPSQTILNAGNLVMGQNNSNPPCPTCVMGPNSEYLQIFNEMVPTGTSMDYSNLSQSFAHSPFFMTWSSDEDSIVSAFSPPSTSGTKAADTPPKPLTAEQMKTSESLKNLVNEMMDKTKTAALSSEFEHINGGATVCGMCHGTAKSVAVLNEYMMSTHCGHVYCSGCLNVYLKPPMVVRVCPLCPEMVSMKTSHRLFL